MPTNPGTQAINSPKPKAKGTAAKRSQAYRPKASWCLSDMIGWDLLETGGALDAPSMRAHEARQLVA